MKKLLILGCCLIVGAIKPAFASGSFEILEGYPVGSCRKASNNEGRSNYALPRNSTCTLNVNYYYSEFDSDQDLIPPVPYQPTFRGVFYWVEEYEKKSARWHRISSKKMVLKNGKTVQIKIKPTITTKYRVAFDSYGMQFGDTFSEEFRLRVK